MTWSYRGAGNLLGNKQSGDFLSGIPLYEGVKDKALLEQARTAAAKSIESYGLHLDKWPSPLLDALSRKVSAGIKASQN